MTDAAPQDALPQSGQSIMPPAAGAAGGEANALLKQTDLLKTNLNEANAAHAKEQARTAELERELNEFRAMKAAALEKYRIEQEPKFTEWYTHSEVETPGMDPRRKAEYYEVFTKPQSKDVADGLYNRMRNTVALAASKKSAEEENARLKAKCEELTEAMNKTTQKMGGMRASYIESSALRADDSIALEASRDSGARRQAASAISARDILTSMPAAHELPFLREYGYSSDVNITASADGRPLKPLRTTMPKVPEHRMLFDQQGECNTPNSMRFWNEPLMSLMVHELATAPADALSSLTRLRPELTTFERPQGDATK